MDYGISIEALGRTILGGSTHHSTISALLVQLLKTAASHEIVFRTHPLGLIDMPLDISPIERSRRLLKRATVHMWHPQISFPQEPASLCHSHGWELRSTVLNGEVGDQMTTVTEIPDGDLRIYHIHYDGNVSISERSDIACTITDYKDPSVHGVGSVYTVPGDTFHRSVIEPSSSLVVTAMVSDNSSSVGSRNVRRAEDGFLLRYERTRVGPRQTALLVRDMVDSLSTKGDNYPAAPL